MNQWDDQFAQQGLSIGVYGGQAQQGLINQTYYYPQGCYMAYLNTASLADIKAELKRRLLEIKAKEAEKAELEKLILALGEDPNAVG